jgi:hypothetical protein
VVSSPRPRTILIAVGAAVFVVVALVLARAFSVGGVERQAVIDVVRAQAGGDPQAVVERLPGCRSSPPCVRAAQVNAKTLRRRGPIQVLRIDPSSQLALRAGTKTARVAWQARGSLPVVQCVTVRRSGSLLSGFTVRLLRVSRPIGRESDCPG